MDKKSLSETDIRTKFITPAMALPIRDARIPYLPRQGGTRSEAYF